MQPNDNNRLKYSHPVSRLSDPPTSLLLSHIIVHQVHPVPLGAPATSVVHPLTITLATPGLNTVAIKVPDPVVAVLVPAATRLEGVHRSGSGHGV